MKNARLNPDVHNYLEDMSDVRRCHLQGAACKIDESHCFSNFCEEYANANDADMARKQEAVDWKKRNADERLRKLWEFELILSFKGKLMKDARCQRANF